MDNETYIFEITIDPEGNAEIACNQYPLGSWQVQQIDGHPQIVPPLGCKIGYKLPLLEAGISYSMGQMLDDMRTGKVYG